MIGSFTNNRRAHGQTLTVAIDGTGDFDTVKAAVDSITDASETKPYTIEVMAGEFIEAPFSMKPFVSIVGREFYGTTLKTSNNSANFIAGARSATLARLSLHGPTGVGFAAFDYTDTGSEPCVVTGVVVKVGHYGFHVHPASSGVAHFIQCGNNYTGVAMQDYLRVTDFGRVAAINTGFMSGPSGALAGSAFLVDGASATLTLDTCFVRAPGSINGFYIDNGATGRAQACTFAGGINALNIGPSGASHLEATGCYIGHTYTKDLLVQSASAGVSLAGGAATKAKFDVTPGADVAASFVDDTPGEEGIVNIGELWLGATSTSSFPLGSFNRDVASTGLVSGGSLSRNATPLDIDYTSGSGYVRTASGLVRVVWTAGTVTAPANIGNGHVWIDKDGVVTAAASAGFNHDNYIEFGSFATNATGVTMMGDHYAELTRSVQNIHSYLQDAIGPIWVSGLATTENATPLKLNVASGSFYTHENPVQAGSNSAITFVKWYRGLAGSWIQVTGQDTINVTQYDDGTGTLATMTAGKYRKDQLWLMVDGDGENYHLVVGQQEFDTYNDALSGASPAAPSAFRIAGIPLAGIIVLKSAASIGEIVSELPIIGGVGGSSGGGSSDHNSLTNLDVGNVHTQYQLRSEEGTANGYAGLDGTSKVPVANLPYATATWNASQIQGKDVNDAAIANGKTLVYNTGTGDLEYGIPSVTLDDLSNVDTTGQARGHGLVFNGTNWVAGFQPFSIECSRNANATNIWLRGTDGLPHNESPVLIPFDAKIVAIAATTNAAETWDAEVYSTTDVRAGGTPTDANKIAELVVSAAQSASSTYNVDVASGTEIGVFCRGTAIDRPRVTLFLVRRA